MGSFEGVLGTRSAWIGGHEVVNVTFDPSKVAYDALLKAAMEKGCATRAWTTTEAQAAAAKARLGNRAAPLTGPLRDAKESDQLYYLSRAAMNYLPLTPLQSRRVNGAMYLRTNPEKWLSPDQLGQLRRVEAKLAKEATALEAFVRPTEIGELAAYAAKLEKALVK